MICLLMVTFALQQVATSFAKGEQEMPPVDATELSGIGIGIRDFIEHIRVI